VRRSAPKRYYTSVVQNVKCIKAIRVWPGDGRFFTSRTRSRFSLMLRLPAPGGSHFSTVLCFTRLPSPSELPFLPSLPPSPRRKPRRLAFFCTTGSDPFPPFPAIHFLYRPFYQFSKMGLCTKILIELDLLIVFESSSKFDSQSRHLRNKI